MTDTTMKPVEAPETPPAAEIAPPARTETTPAHETAPAVEHTPGGWPVVPLALTGTNATASLLGSAALVGGPAALAVAATGAAALGTAAAVRTRRDRTKPHARSASRKAAAGGRRGAGGGVPRQSRGSAPGTSGRKPGKGSGKGAGVGRRSASAGSASGGLTARKGKGHASSKAGAGAPGSTGAGKSRGRVGQVKALREAQRSAAPTRAQRRAAASGARRSAADARRDAKSRARNAASSGKGSVGRTLARGLDRAGRARGAAVDRSRAARDRQAAGRVADQRSALRRAPARNRARRALLRSASRYQGRRLLAVLLAGALGVIGLVSTPLGRRLGVWWMQHPGRRLYARMTGTAAQQRTDRDQSIRAAQQDEEAAAEAEAADDGSEEIKDRAERPETPVPAPSEDTTEGEHMSGFRFEDHAAEMETAAQSYDPDNAMEILAMVEGLPAAITSVANVMKTLAERADSEFPLEKEVADGFNDIFGAVMSAVAVAEDMGPLFRQAHEQDIARHEDPRNGPEAEKGWNV
ncbi:hypothetical protein [Streptomyces sp. WMMB303]|uniref:hypothetical protein n=1 Tax=Streptomyces sp. WMMB303 TaxID=3034154 RepID=UPI0023EC1273|nr:hypothetical protein [Streptomyces sp. WMMB303]MDF4250465.1 hypothetical protein [Streptomyces sp. WMMB303]